MCVCGWVCVWGVAQLEKLVRLILRTVSDLLFCVPLVLVVVVVVCVRACVSGLVHSFSGDYCCPGIVGDKAEALEGNLAFARLFVEKRIRRSAVVAFTQEQPCAPPRVNFRRMPSAARYLEAHGEGQVGTHEPRQYFRSVSNSLRAHNYRRCVTSCLRLCALYLWFPPPPPPPHSLPFPSLGFRDVSRPLIPFPSLSLAFVTCDMLWWWGCRSYRVLRRRIVRSPNATIAQFRQECAAQEVHVGRMVGTRRPLSSTTNTNTNATTANTRTSGSGRGAGVSMPSGNQSPSSMRRELAALKGLLRGGTDAQGNSTGEDGQASTSDCDDADECVLGLVCVVMSCGDH